MHKANMTNKMKFRKLVFNTSHFVASSLSLICLLLFCDFYKPCGKKKFIIVHDLASQLQLWQICSEKKYEFNHNKYGNYKHHVYHLFCNACVLHFIICLFHVQVNRTGHYFIALDLHYRRNDLSSQSSA